MDDKPISNSKFQTPTIHDLDRAMLRRALFEIIGLGLIALAILIVSVRINGWSWQTLGDGLIVVSVVELMILGTSFILKEPAIERIAKLLVSTVRARWQAHAVKTTSATQTAPEVYVRTTNQADADYDAALDALEASLKQLAKRADGETLKGKPWARRTLVASGIIKDDYAQWSRVMSLWERAGIIASRDASELMVSTYAQGRTLLKALMERDGYVLVNDTWMKR